jgi:succinylglutamate desuccinylase
LHGNGNSCEAKRAKEINQLLGPKQFDDSSESTEKADSDVIIDLHTTTTNMGTTLIVGAGDQLMTQCAAYIRAKCGDNVHILMHTHKRQQDRPQLSSIASSCMSIEVGPVPQGVLRHDVVEKTQAALEVAFEFLDKSQSSQETRESLQKELKEYYPSGQVPCYRSAPSQREGEMSSKIPWPCDPENENFPAWMVYKDLQDEDFVEIKTGDPLFVDLDGTVIAYDGSHGSPVRLMFINEGGYYYASSGTGISVAQLGHFDLESGELI